MQNAPPASDTMQTFILVREERKTEYNNVWPRSEITFTIRYNAAGNPVSGTVSQSDNWDFYWRIDEEHVLFRQDEEHDIEVLRKLWNSMITNMVAGIPYKRFA